jgi:hypothetical protein
MHQSTWKTTEEESDFVLLKFVIDFYSTLTEFTFAIFVKKIITAYDVMEVVGCGEVEFWCESYTSMGDSTTIVVVAF